MKHYSYNPSTKICSVIYDGCVLKATLEQPEALIVESMFDADVPFSNIKDFFNSFLGIEEKVIEAPTEEKTLRLMISSKFFTTNSDDNKILYRNNEKLSLPQSLVDAYVQAYIENDEQRITALDCFWYRMGVCPVDYARQDAFWFLSRQGFRIFKNGLFLAARNIVKVKNEFDDLVGEWVEKVKNSWKQKLSNVEVYEQNGEYVLFDVTNKNVPKGKLLGTLQQLYDQIGTVKYTDGYTGKMRIELGKPVFQSRDLCDHNRHQTCSQGLHFASIDHFSQSSYAKSFGAVSILVAIDPIDLVAIPPADGYWKGRCCRYLPLTIVERDVNGNIIMPDLTELEQLLDDYGKYILAELEAKALSANPADVEINFIKGFTSITAPIDNLYERLSQYATTQSTPILDNEDNYDDDDDNWGDDEEKDYWGDDEEEDYWG